MTINTGQKAISPSVLTRRFHEVFGHPIRTTLQYDIPELRMRVSILKEEVCELVEAFKADSIVDVADALGDIVYVAFGSSHAHGFARVLDFSFGNVDESPSSFLYESFTDEGYTAATVPNLNSPDAATLIGVMEQMMNEYEDYVKIRDVEHGDAFEIQKYITYIVTTAYYISFVTGINIDEVLVHIQESNMSKLGEDGKPIYREDGKVLKGPGFFKPEPKIHALINSWGGNLGPYIAEEPTPAPQPEPTVEPEPVTQAYELTEFEVEATEQPTQTGSVALSEPEHSADSELTEEPTAEEAPEDNLLEVEETEETSVIIDTEAQQEPVIDEASASETDVNTSAPEDSFTSEEEAESFTETATEDAETLPEVMESIDIESSADFPEEAAEEDVAKFESTPTEGTSTEVEPEEVPEPVAARTFYNGKKKDNTTASQFNEMQESLAAEERLFEIAAAKITQSQNEFIETGPEGVATDLEQQRDEARAELEAEAMNEGPTTEVLNLAAGVGIDATQAEEETPADDDSAEEEPASGPSSSIEVKVAESDEVTVPSAEQEVADDLFTIDTTNKQ